MQHPRSGNRRRRSRRSGAATAIEWRALRREPRAVVRSTLPEAMPAAGAAGQGERGEVCDERCAKRRREENAAVVTPIPSNAATTVADRHSAVSVSEPPGKRSAQRPKGAEARGIPARRVETAQRARQGSPVAKRRAQPHRMVTRHRIHIRHHRLHHRLHRRQQHRRQSQRQHRRRRNRHRHRHHNRYRRRRELHGVVEAVMAVEDGRAAAGEGPTARGGAAKERGSRRGAWRRRRRAKRSRSLRRQWCPTKEKGPRRRSDAARGGEAV